MPKSTRKKKEKASDFTKAKLKLGKGKQQAANAIDTSFKARSIVLPNQSITAEKDVSQPTTRRHLNLLDLVSHLKHYNAGTRVDAIQGLRELLEGNPELRSGSLSKFIAPCARLIGDEDASVRRTLFNFLSWLLPLVSSLDVQPHASLLLLFTSSALSHIFPEIRVDAAKVLDLLLYHVPQAATLGWDAQSSENGDEGPGQRLLHGCMSVLNITYTSDEQKDFTVGTSSVSLMPKSQMAVLTTLAHFVECAVQSSQDSDEAQGGIPTWYFSSVYSTPTGFSDFLRVLRPCFESFRTNAHRWRAHVDLRDEVEDFLSSYPLSRLEAPSWTFGELNSALKIKEHNIVTAGRELATFELLRAVLPLLSAIFSENAPLLFTPGLSTIPETELLLVHTSLRLTQCLSIKILSRKGNHIEETCQLVAHYVTQMAGYLPTTFHSTGRVNYEAEQRFQDLNIMYCQLISSLVAVGTESKQGAAVTQPQVEKAASYVIDRLNDEDLFNAGVRLSAESYRSLLPSVWALLNCPSVQRGRCDASITKDLLRSLVSHDNRVASNSATKRLSTEFIARLVLIKPSTTFSAVDHSCALLEWMVNLPRVLWELGNSNNQTSEIIFRFILRTCQRQFHWITRETLNLMEERLVPYFMMIHPQRGNITGPYTKLPATTVAPLRILALDTVHTLLELNYSDKGGNESPLAQAVRFAIGGMPDQKYWLVDT